MPDKARRVEKARLNGMQALIMCLAVWQTGNHQVFHIVLRGADRRITFGDNEDCFRFTALPMSSITKDIQSIDIPMNYTSLYMRPVIFSSLALIYRIWLDLRKAQIQGENR